MKILTILIILIGWFILFVIIKRLTKHREVWDDIPDVKFQEELNKTRKKMKVPLKKIDYKTGRIQ